MPLIIDGYNLLNATGITGSGAARSELQRSRTALLNFLAEKLTPREVAQTIVVFDASGAPPGLPATLEHRGLVVRFAKGYSEADELIVELIRAETSPRRLTVVSSDHAVQRAARRRRATAIDSEAWFAEIERRRAPPSAARDNSRPAGKLSPDDVQYWLSQFATAAEPFDKPAQDDEIFPPGYAEDISEDSP